MHQIIEARLQVIVLVYTLAGLDLGVFTLEKLLNECEFSAVKIRAVYLEEFTVRAVKLVFNGNLIRIDKYKHIAYITVIVTAQVEIRVVCRSKHRCLISFCYIKDKEGLVFRPCVEDLCIEISGETAGSVR